MRDARTACSDYNDVGGIKLPTKHSIFPRTPDGQSLAEPLIVSIDLSEIAFTRTRSSRSQRKVTAMSAGPADTVPLADTGAPHVAGSAVVVGTARFGAGRRHRFPTADHGRA